MSDRGTAINCFNNRISALKAGQIDLQEFRKLVTEDISKALNMPLDECGYLFSKARRAAERSGSFNELDFGAAKRATVTEKNKNEPVKEQGVVVNKPKRAKTEDLDDCYTVVEVHEDGITGRTYSFSALGVARIQHEVRNKQGGAWKLIK